MSDLPSVLGIEAVECVAEGSSLTIRVTGRWRRRRPEWQGPAMLVVEVDGRRRRFPAMPEPPSLTGTLPGTWRMSFSVPADIAPYLAGRTWLQLGAVLAPLPIDIEATLGAAGRPGQTAEPPAPPEPDILTARRLRASELAVQHARRRAAEAEAAAEELVARIDRLEQELDEARRAPERIRQLVTQRERELQAAEQRVHSEGALRREVEEELRRREHELSRSHGRVQALEQRGHELERELRRLRRAADEAGHLADAAQAARARTEQRLQELAAAAGPEAIAEPLRAEILQREQRLAQGRPRAEPPPPREVPAAPSPALAREREMLARRDLAALIETERAERARARERVAALERELSVQRRRSAQAYEAIAEVRAELERMQAQLERQAPVGERGVEPPGSPPPAGFEPLPPPEPPQAVDPPSPEPPQAVDPSPPTPAPGPAGPVDTGRLSEALVRLRAAVPPAERPAEPTAAPEPAPEPEPPPAEPPPPEPRPTQPPPEQPRAEAPPPEAQPPPPAKPPPREPQPPPKPWLRDVFAALVAQDPISAGRLVLQLLPLQRDVRALPVAYDLVLKDVTVQVTIGAGPPEVRFADLPRPRDQVQLRIVGDLPSLARTLAAGRLRRLLGRGMAEVSGDRRVLEGLRQVVRAPRTLQQLDEAGIVLDPDLAFTVVSRMIAPAWTRSERFTIAHETPGASEPAVYLQIADGAAPRVAERASEQAVTTTIVCPPEALLPVLSGQDPASAHVRGDRRPLSLLVHWVQRAQSG